MSIWFDCKKCEEHLAASENKTGVLIACPKCRARNKIPGIAMQKQATKKQIEQMEASLKQHRQCLWMFFIMLFFIIGMAIITALMATLTESSNMSESAIMGSGISITGLGILVGFFIILVRIFKTCEYLGASKYVQLFLFFFLSPIWVIMCFILYAKLKNRLAYLKQAGIRADDA